MSLNITTPETEFQCGASRGKCSETRVVITPRPAHKEEPFYVARSTLKALENLMLDPRLDSFQQNMLSSKIIIGDPSVDLTKRESSRIIRKQIGSAQNLRAVGKVGLKNKPLSIKDKISEWEGKRESPSPVSAWKEDERGVKEELTTFLEKITRDSVATRQVDTKRVIKWPEASKQNDRRAGTPKSAGQPVEKQVDMKLKAEEPNSSAGKGGELKENLSVLSQVKKLEQALKGGSTELQPQLPGTYYSPHYLQEKTDEGQSPSESQEITSRLELGRRLISLDSETSEPIFGTLEEVKTPRTKCKPGSEENVYTEPGLPEKKPFINPLPKPQRTFKHEGEEGWVPPVRNKRNLPPLPSIPPPPLPSSPPPSAVSRRLRSGKHKTNADHRYLLP